MYPNTSLSTFECLEGRTLFAVPTDLDTAFSGDGRVITDFGGANDVAHAVAVQGDGKIVVAGETQVTVNGVKKTAFAAVRYNKDGSLDDGGSKDTTKGDKFGVGGKFMRVVSQGGGTGALAVAVQKGGRIILGGNALTGVPNADPTEWCFLRLNKDGALDSTYGKSGVYSTAFTNGLKPQFNAMVLQADGRLVAAGGLERNWILIRLTTAGQLDKSFGASGRGLQEADFGSTDTAKAIALDHLGNIVVAGDAGSGGVGIAKFSSNGIPDAAFGDFGKVIYLTGGTSGDTGSLTILQNGNIDVGYAAVVSAGGLVSSPTIPVGGDVSYSGTGEFIGGGYRGGRSSANGLVTTPNDVTVLGGTSNISRADRFYVEELTKLPTEITFGSSTDHNFATAMTIGPDGKIVQVGYTTAGGGGRNFAIARYLGSPVSGLATISGNVFNDLDKDGVKDANESNQVDVRVYIDLNSDNLFDPATERSVLTDRNGNYKLSVGPGTYRLREVSPPGLTQTFGFYTLNVAAKQAISGVNFGNVLFSTPNPSTRIVGSVFFDFDGDGLRDIQNPTEPDLVGRTVFLDTNGNDKLDLGEPKTVTDAGGNYIFDNLTPGNYRVGDILPAGWTHTDPSSGFFDVAVVANQTVVRRFATTFADPDDTIAEVDHAPGNQISVGGAVNFSIANVTDVDLVRFSVKKGQRVGFDLDRATGSSLNALLRLFDANGNQLASNDDGAAPGEAKSSDSYFAFTFSTAGNYYIGVSNNANKGYDSRFGYGDNGVGTTGGYKLSLASIPTASVASRLTPASLSATSR